MRKMRTWRECLIEDLADFADLGGFLEKLKSKAKVLGIPIREAPHFFASSKTCSSCGYVKDDLSLSERTFQCDWCNSEIDRDQNAAINLKKLSVGNHMER